jgi:hypothetical protein
MAAPREDDEAGTELPPPQQQAELNPKQLPKELQEPAPPPGQNEQKG